MRWKCSLFVLQNKMLLWFFYLVWNLEKFSFHFFFGMTLSLERKKETETDSKRWLYSVPCLRNGCASSTPWNKAVFLAALLLLQSVQKRSTWVNKGVNVIKIFAISFQSLIYFYHMHSRYKTNKFWFEFAQLIMAKHDVKWSQDLA